MCRLPVKLSALVLLTALANPLLADDDEPSLLWEAAGFEAPESVRYDAERERLYVSNINGNPTDKDGNGYLSLLSPSGEVLMARWLAGFDAPKGMALVGKKLYVSDIDRLVVVDVEAAEIVATYDAPEAKFLNDVTADASGRVYVSDMGDNTIYRLNGTAFDVWLRDSALDSPNGLLAEEDRLLVASWGVVGQGADVQLGVMRAVSWEDRSVSALDGAGIGHLDGLEKLPSAEDAEGEGDGQYLITDWVNGVLFTWAEGDDGDSKLTLALDLPAGSADIGTLPGEGVVIVPLMKDGIVQAYSLPDDEDE
ncbi:MAG: ATP/GTP-binding protein [Pseudomonadota bacterium]